MEDVSFIGERLTTESIFCCRLVYRIVFNLDFEMGEGDFGRVGLITNCCSWLRLITDGSCSLIAQRVSDRLDGVTTQEGLELLPLFVIPACEIFA